VKQLKQERKKPVRHTVERD